MAGMTGASIAPWGSQEWVKEYIATYGFPPIAGGDDGGDGEDGGNADPAGDPNGEDGGNADPAAGASGGDDGGDDGSRRPPTGDAPAEEWKRYARSLEKRTDSGKAKVDRRVERIQKERDDLADRLKKHEDAAKSDQEKAVDEARAEGRKEAVAASNVRLVKAEIRAAAAGKLEYPELATADLLDLKVEDLVDADGEVDSAAIVEAIETLLEKKPKLAAGQATRPSGSADAGKGSGGSGSLEDMSLDDHFEAVKRQK